MLRKGPLPRFVHGIWEYAVGVLLVASPFLFHFDDAGAKAVAIVVGIAVIGLAASTAGASGLVDQIGLKAHAAFDYVVVAVLVASPFLFGFTDEGGATALFIVLGVAQLLVSIATRYLPERV